ncbi:hypothetical protein KI387_033032, partial [Taxus chinensis]
DVYCSLIMDTSIYTLMCNVSTNVFGGVILEWVDDILGEHAHIFDLVAIVATICRVLLGERDE